MHGGNHATALFPARLCSQRRAMAGVTSRRDGAFADEEPSGFVFEEANTEREESLGASVLLAAAGAPVLVLDGADDVKVWQCVCFLVLCGGRVLALLLRKGGRWFGNRRVRHSPQCNDFHKSHRGARCIGIAAAYRVYALFCFPSH